MTDEMLGASSDEPTNPAAKDPADITKAEASEHIERLQQKTGRGQ